jgi:hypothetical protein
MDIDVSLDRVALDRALRQSRKQAVFAAAVALTRTAQEAQGEVVAELPERFTIRTGWVARGIRIQPARRDRLEAVVYSRDEFMARQETGGTKEGRNGKSVAKPVEVRRNPGQTTRPSRWPGALLDKPSFFAAPLSTQGAYATARTPRAAGGPRHLVGRSSHGLKMFSRSASRNRDYGDVEYGIWMRSGRKQRMSKGRYKGKMRQPIRLMYLMAPSVEIEPRLGMGDTVRRVAFVRFADNFEQAFAAALATAR